MNNFLSDEDLDQMYEEGGVGDGVALPAPPTRNDELMMPPVAAIPPYPVYPIMPQKLTPGMGEANFFTQKVGPLPVWGWGLVAAGLGVGGWYWWRQKAAAVAPNASSVQGDIPSLPDSTEAKWSPSRSRFGEQLRKHFTRKGMADRATIYTDADEAKKKLKQVSPLITIKVDGSYKIDGDLEKLCRREGLNPILHEDASIGLYPTETKRGKEWEEYIDALRDDGQAV